MDSPDSDTDSICDVSLGIHSIGNPATEPVRRQPSKHEQVCIDVLGKIECIHQNLKSASLSLEELDTELMHAVEAAKRTCRSAALEFEANTARHAMILQEAQEEISARDVFIARVVERMRAKECGSTDAAERDKAAFLQSVADARKIQAMMDALLPSHTQLDKHP